jgi:Flp pilus assembly protein CpaB
MRKSLSQPAIRVASPIIDPNKARFRGIILTTAALVLAILAGLATYAFAESLAKQPIQPVVVALKPIVAGARITPDAVGIVEIRSKDPLPSFFADVADVLDGNTTTLINIAQGDYIQQNMVSHNGGLQPGMVAHSIPIDPVTAVNILPGNRVGVIMSYVDPQSRPTTSLLLPNVLVLAVDSPLSVQGNVPGQPFQAGLDGKLKLTPSRSVTLGLTPQESLMLAHAEDFAKELHLIIWRLDEPPVPAMSPIQLINRATGAMPWNMTPDTIPMITPTPENGGK